MKNLAYIVFAIICFSFTQDNNTILWQATTKLKWIDFKGIPNTSFPYKALTGSEIKPSISVKNNEVHITIIAVFDKTQSWTKDTSNKNLLAHEQLHFDITELWARKFRQQLKGKIVSAKTFQAELNAIQASVYKESKEMQSTYDMETKHSEDIVNQQKWNEKIKRDLNALNAFSVTEVSCTLTK